MGPGPVMGFPLPLKWCHILDNVKKNGVAIQVTDDSKISTCAVYVR